VRRVGPTFELGESVKSQKGEGRKNVENSPPVKKKTVVGREEAIK